MPDDLDDIFGDDGDDVTDDDAAAGQTAPAATGSTPAAAAEPPAAAAAPDPPKPDENAALLNAALGTLRSEWVDKAKAAGYAAADFDSIGLKGFTEAARDEFLAEAKASHEAQVKRLEALGFHYDPNKSAADAAAQAQAAADAAAQDAWGPTGPPTTATEGEVADEAVRQSVKAGDTMGTIRALAGLGDFVLKGRK